FPVIVVSMARKLFGASQTIGSRRRPFARQRQRSSRRVRGASAGLSRALFHEAALGCPTKRLTLFADRLGFAGIVPAFFQETGQRGARKRLPIAARCLGLAVVSPGRAENKQRR